jgi:ubiquinone/menaquinone biosynthesis C-methylase UbiE
MTKDKINQACGSSAALAARWHAAMKAATFQGKGVAFWDNWVRSLPSKHEHSSYVEEVLALMDCRQGDTVLDVGAGTGALCLPLARRVRAVTALDHSRSMLDHIMAQAAAGGIVNIQPLLLDWVRARPGLDFGQHDIVLVSRSLPAGDDILRCLELVNRSAGRICYVSWKMSGYDPLEAALCRRLGLKYRTFPGADLLCSIVQSMGISPRLDTFITRGKRVYESLEQACTQILRSGAGSEDVRETATAFLAANLKSEGGIYIQPKETSWALISWQRG